MKSLKSSGKPKKLKLIFFRRVIGKSMLPTLKPGQIIIVSGIYGNLGSDSVVVFNHDNMEKIKRIKDVRRQKMFVVGDNHKLSVDSRSFGWLSKEKVIGKIIWPRI
ncbi:MAG TPA: S26 family signal peptidase [Candidatus Saccharimonadales bacterium]|nr:S26 family signal peptidase [Candidatus Saccharimonadales bacterium]